MPTPKKVTAEGCRLQLYLKTDPTPVAASPRCNSIYALQQEKIKLTIKKAARVYHASTTHAIEMLNTHTKKTTKQKKFFQLFLAR
ncbi:MAG: hypothetical protein LBQ66_15575 [Planctomycetaceae bacterium]|jgi:hypothetical protein|nr:hypothetical protein [Planctomycetaceae bacterium]